MFPGNQTGLSLGKIIGGLSKTLQIANQVIPLYEKARPLVQSATNALKKIQKPVSTSNNDSSQTKKTITLSNSFNNPSFFK